MARKSTIKKDALVVPQTRSGAEQLIEEIGTLQRQLTRIEADMNDELATIKAKYEAKAQPLNTTISQAFDAVHAWAEANRSNLLTGRVKHVRLATGEIAWRITPPKVSIRGADVVLDALQRLAPQMVRTKPEIDKDAILADPDAVSGIKGISITQKEEFKVKPFESEIERSVTQNLQEVA